MQRSHLTRVVRAVVPTSLMDFAGMTCDAAAAQSLMPHFRAPALETRSLRPDRPSTLPEEWGGRVCAAANPVAAPAAAKVHRRAMVVTFLQLHDEAHRFRAAIAG